jgi:hypothetical protein
MFGLEKTITMRLILDEYYRQQQGVALHLSAWLNGLCRNLIIYGSISSDINNVDNSRAGYGVISFPRPAGLSGE